MRFQTMLKRLEVVSVLTSGPYVSRRHSNVLTKDMMRSTGLTNDRLTD